jgi:predicted transcriptional regulator
MKSSPTVTLAFRVHREKAAALEKLAESTDRDRSWLLEQALDEYLLNQAWQIEALEEGIADADAGRMVPHEKMREWLLSWGKEDELEPPV